MGKAFTVITKLRFHLINESRAHQQKLYSILEIK